MVKMIVFHVYSRKCDSVEEAEKGTQKQPGVGVFFPPHFKQQKCC